MYKRKVNTAVHDVNAEPEIEADTVVVAEEDVDVDVVAECDDEEENTGEGELKVEENDIEEFDMVAELSDEYQGVVDKVRKIVKFFRRSPTQNDDVLQKNVKQDKGKELSLILDCRTRWSSLLSMLSRFLELRCSIQKSLIDLKMSGR